MQLNAQECNQHRFTIKQWKITLHSEVYKECSAVQFFSPLHCSAVLRVQLCGSRGKEAIKASSVADPSEAGQARVSNTRLGAAMGIFLRRIRLPLFWTLVRIYWPCAGHAIIILAFYHSTTTTEWQIVSNQSNLRVGECFEKLQIECDKSKWGIISG